MKQYNKISWQSGVLLGLVSVIACLPAHASELETLEESWYIGGGLGMSQLTPDGGDLWGVDDDKAFSKKVYAGFNIGRDFGLEAFWNDLGEATVKHNKTGEEGSVKYSSYGANLVYHVPSYMGSIHPIAKLGVAKVDTKGSGVDVNQKNKFDVMLGVGAEMELNEGFRIRAEYERFDEDINQLSIGLNWRPVLYRQPIEAPQPMPQPVMQREQSIVIVNQAQAQAQAPVFVPAPRPAPAPKPEVKTVVKTVVKHVPVVVRTPAPKPIVRTIIKQAPPVIQKVHIPAPQPKAQPRVIHKTLAGGSHFASNSATLTQSGRSALDRMASDLLRDQVVIHNITIIGHTDSVGTDAANLRLSQQRAQTVANYLGSRGLNRNGMTVIGRGEQEPIADNKTAAGRAQNRRVNLVVKGSQTIAP